MRRYTAILITLLAALALAACGGDDEDGDGNGETAEQAQTAQRTATTEEPGAAVCERVRAPEPRDEQDIPEPTFEVDPDTTYLARVETNCGDFTITLDAENSPRTASSFISLVRRGFYDGLSFHRVVPGFVIQGGDPLGDGRGGPGYTVVEAPPDDVTYTRGTVAMAKTEIEDPGTSGSQFFIVTAEDAMLPPDFAVLGEVSAGQDVVDKIGALPTDPTTEQPVDPAVIERIRVTAR